MLSPDSAVFGQNGPPAATSNPGRSSASLTECCERIRHQPFATRFVDRGLGGVDERYLKTFSPRRNSRSQPGRPPAYDQHTNALPHVVSSDCFSSGWPEPYRLDVLRQTGMPAMHGSLFPRWMCESGAHTDWGSLHNLRLFE